MKRVFIVHGWADNPSKAWFPWLKAKLEEQGFQVYVPHMPVSILPLMENWIPYLTKAVGTPDSETYFVGHSIGVQTILRYLETIDVQIGGVVAVAGFFTINDKAIPGLEYAKKFIEPWIATPMDLDKIKFNAHKIFAIFSDNDNYVPIENAERFKNDLNAKVLILSNRGHFATSNKAKEVPEALEAMLDIAGRSNFQLLRINT